MMPSVLQPLDLPGLPASPPPSSPHHHLQLKRTYSDPDLLLDSTLSFDHNDRPDRHPPHRDSAWHTPRLGPRVHIDLNDIEIPPCTKSNPLFFIPSTGDCDSHEDLLYHSVPIALQNAAAIATKATGALHPASVNMAHLPYQLFSEGAPTLAPPLVFGASDLDDLSAELNSIARNAPKFPATPTPTLNHDALRHRSDRLDAFNESRPAFVDQESSSSAFTQELVEEVVQQRYLSTTPTPNNKLAFTASSTVPSSVKRPSTSSGHPPSSLSTGTNSSDTMVKQRRSLQSVLIPSFLPPHTPTRSPNTAAAPSLPQATSPVALTPSAASGGSHTHRASTLIRSTSESVLSQSQNSQSHHRSGFHQVTYVAQTLLRRGHDHGERGAESPPPDFLLDDDPFANLTSPTRPSDPSTSSMSDLDDDSFRAGTESGLGNEAPSAAPPTPISPTSASTYSYSSPTSSHSSYSYASSSMGPPSLMSSTTSSPQQSPRLSPPSLAQIITSTTHLEYAQPYPNLQPPSTPRTQQHVQRFASPPSPLASTATFVMEDLAPKQEGASKKTARARTRSAILYNTPSTPSPTAGPRLRPSPSIPSLRIRNPHLEYAPPPSRLPQARTAGEAGAPSGTADVAGSAVAPRRRSGGAAQRPAFASRPSLPSLHTLARMEMELDEQLQAQAAVAAQFDALDSPSMPATTNIPARSRIPLSKRSVSSSGLAGLAALPPSQAIMVLPMPKKPRKKGHVGADLPYEPWSPEKEGVVRDVLTRRERSKSVGKRIPTSPSSAAPASAHTIPSISRPTDDNADAPPVPPKDSDSVTVHQSSSTLKVPELAAQRPSSTLSNYSLDLDLAYSDPALEVFPDAVPGSATRKTFAYPYSESRFAALESDSESDYGKQLDRGHGVGVFDRLRGAEEDDGDGSDDSDLDPFMNLPSPRRVGSRDTSRLREEVRREAEAEEDMKARPDFWRALNRTPEDPFYFDSSPPPSPMIIARMAKASEAATLQHKTSMSRYTSVSGLSTSASSSSSSSRKSAESSFRTSGSSVSGGSRKSGASGSSFAPLSLVSTSGSTSLAQPLVSRVHTEKAEASPVVPPPRLSSSFSVEPDQEHHEHRKHNSKSSTELPYAHSEQALLESLESDNNPDAHRASLLAVRAAAMDEFEPGSSAGTVRPSDAQRARERLLTTSAEMHREDGEVSGAVGDEERGRKRYRRAMRLHTLSGGEPALVDGSEWPTSGGGGSGYSSHYSGGGGGSGYSGSGGSYGQGYSGGGDGRGGGMSTGGAGDGGKDGRSRSRSVNTRSTFSSPSPEPSDSDSDYSSDGNDETRYGAGEEPSASRRGSPGRPKDGSASNTDDDVPLAQRIPTALKAQKTIRREVREEREKRKATKRTRDVEKQQGRTARSAPLGTSSASSPRLPTSRPSTQEAQFFPASSSRATQPPQTMPVPTSRRQPQINLSSNASSPPSQHQQQLRADDLARRLMSVQTSSSPPTRSPRPPQEQSPNGSRSPRIPAYHSHQAASPMSPSSPMMPSKDMPATGRRSEDVSRQRTLHPMRSFQNGTTQQPETEVFNPIQPVPLGQFDAQLQGMHPDVALRVRAKSMSRSKPPSMDLTDSLAALSRSQTTSQRPSQDLTRKKEPNVLRRATSAGRSSSEAERTTTATRPAQRPPMPPLPSGIVPQLPTTVVKGDAIQVRVYIRDMQMFNVVEIGSNTTAGDVLDMVQARGELDGWAGIGGWMLWDIANDFGMERPIRSYELPMDVYNSWNAEKRINIFMIKRTPLAGILSRNAMPSKSPVHGGYVEWESKRGRWNKRWLILKEHNLFLAKRDTSHDHVFLCSLSNFDGYLVQRIHKAPKPFVFAVKSTDNISFFENTADYVHVFSCNAKEGDNWLEAILLARSYVLSQERTVLFQANTTSASASSSAAPKGVSRSGTRKQPSASRPVPSQPLVNMNDQAAFEPGSLLAKRATDGPIGPAVIGPSA